MDGDNGIANAATFNTDTHAQADLLHQMLTSDTGV
jgi:hypothetical protein